MASEEFDFKKYFATDNLVNFGIYLNDQRFFQDSAVIKSIQNDLAQLEVLGEGLPEGTTAEIGAKIVITSKEAWALCRCRATLDRPISGKQVFVRILGEVDVQQRREYFRWDVNIPVTYSVPANQQFSSISRQWEFTRLSVDNMKTPNMVPWQEGFKVVNWKNGRDVLPLPVNLSGNGLRFRTKECLAPEALLNLEIFLPLVPARVICVVGSVIRVNEIRLDFESDAHYSTAMHFELIDDGDRETIISYLFAEQRNSLRMKAEKKA